MNPISCVDNILSIDGVIVNLFDLSIFGEKQNVVISFNNVLNGPTLYGLYINKYRSSIYNLKTEYTIEFKLSVDQINNLSPTIQYANILFSNPTINLYNTLTDKSVIPITFAIKPFTIIPTYTKPSQFIILDNTNSWNNYLKSLNLTLTYINNILTCKIGDTIELVNFTSTNPITLSYNDIVINTFNSYENRLFILDPTTISNTTLFPYQLPKFILENVKLTSPDISTPLLFLDISLIPTYT